MGIIEGFATFALETDVEEDEYDYQRFQSHRFDSLIDVQSKCQVGTQIFVLNFSLATTRITKLESC